jgi:ssDNA-binding Zn-finger/Zn-ribbon topoisomerase 1
MSTRKRSIEKPEEDVVAVPLKKTKKAKEPEIIIEDNTEDENEEVDDFGVEKMPVPKIKEMLKERDLSVKGDKKVLSKRLIERLTKEKNPDYEPRRLGRHCKWCDSLMKKKRGIKGDFYGCTAYPECQYTTSLSGYAKPTRDFLKGQPATNFVSRDRLDWAHARYSQEDKADRAADREDRKEYRKWT